MLCISAAYLEWSALPQWRPRFHGLYPRGYRRAIRCLVMLAKARESADVASEMRYSHAALCRLPEELLQYLCVWLTMWPTFTPWVSEIENRVAIGLSVPFFVSLW